MSAIKKQQLEALCNRLDRIHAFVSNITDRTSYCDVKVRLDMLNEVWDQFVVLEIDLIKAADTKDTRDTFESRFCDLKALLSEAEETLRKPNNAPLQGTVIDQLASTQNEFLSQLKILNKSNSRSRTSHLKLPAIVIPQFSGVYREWPSFQDLFINTIHNDANMPKVHKIHYLQNFLIGDAASIIRHLNITEQNYDEAWCKLKERYDKKQYIIGSFIELFMTQSTISQPTSNNLRKLYDVSDEVIRGLSALGDEAVSRDHWLIHILLSKLDSETHQLWAQYSTNIELPSFDDFLKFLNNRCSALETAQVYHPKRATNTKVKTHTTSTSSIISCPNCNEEHKLYKCEQFKALNQPARNKFVIDTSLCINCLHPGHNAKKCFSRFKCHICKRKHHTLLHANTEQPTISSNSSSVHCDQILTASSQAISHSTPDNNVSLPSSQVQSSESKSLSISHCNLSINTQQSSTITPRPCNGSNHLLINNNQISSDHELNIQPMIFSSLLPTIEVHVKDRFGKYHTCRILVDTGSESNLITETFAHTLLLPRYNALYSVHGLGESKAGATRGAVRINLLSKYDHRVCYSIDALILPKLTSSLPAKSFTTHTWSYLNEVELADPLFNKSRPINMIVGVSAVFKMLKSGYIQGPHGHPDAVETLFGWMVGGNLSCSKTFLESNLVQLPETSNEELNGLLSKFWEIEEIAPTVIMSDEEIACEVHFKNHTHRSETGRYIVKLPFKDTPTQLGHSRKQALNRLYAMERKFAKDPQLKADYLAFLNEYIALGHMERVPESERNSIPSSHFYMPHHGIKKDTSTTTKLRVVFDGSAKSSTGVSLNNLLMVGPVIQKSLFSILIDFRKHKIALVADLEKMYRQVLVEKEDVNFQRILWRSDCNKPVEEYRLLTVTYGLASSSFLATRTIFEIANNTQSSKIAAILKDNFYVDDLMTGGDSIEAVKCIQSELIKVFHEAGFHLRKFKSSSSDVTCDALNSEPIKFEENSETTKVLGIQWNPSTDTFSFNVNFGESKSSPTKRSILSESSRLFDPLGWLAPSTVLIKILYQKLWLLNLSWDDSVPQNVANHWNSLRTDFKEFSRLKIQRCIMPYAHRSTLHGFCDASESAYAAVVYLRCEDSTGTTDIHLIASKTKVCPIRQISIARLELCAAVLLTRLILSVKESLLSINPDIQLWTDSTTVLAWLSSHPRRWKCFIANRCTEILAATPRHFWHHISSKDNPADCASRGLSPANLISFEFWWHGPKWLREPTQNWPSFQSSFETTMEIKPVKDFPSLSNVIAPLKINAITDLFSKYSSITKLFRILAYSFRFINCIKKKLLPSPFLTTSEIQYAKIFCFKLVQKEAYSCEINALTRQKQLNSNSKIGSLNPFLDDIGLLRVGGRLKNSDLSFNAKHPILLPRDHVITSLLAGELHQRHLHVGPSHLMSLLQREYWIPGCRRLVRKLTQSCVTCIRYRKRIDLKQIMGDLPSARVNLSSRPFVHTGVDYAGPFNLKNHVGRNSKTFKGYILLLVCLTTKALHIELVSDLTTDAFLAALRRFTSRRGKPACMYSDNGTTFVGAYRELKELYQFLNSEHHQRCVTDHLFSDGIQWKYIPPHAPHFGGIWEAGVKSVKSHLRKVVSNSVLTYEQMSTLLCQIESILNSRPISPLSNDPESFDTLTPGHFLIGEPLTQIPDPDLSLVPINRLSKYQFIQNLVQGFWKRWKNDYLSTLQQRQKWKKHYPNVKVGDLVLLRDDITSPNLWPMGRITKCSPGADGYVRVVNLKTASGEYTRPIVKIVPLLIEDSNPT